jgi:transposase InsO family protein
MLRRSSRTVGLKSIIFTSRPRIRLAAASIQPGKPQQNAHIERYNRTVRHEWLGQYLFRTIEEVKDTATEWLWTYNHERPNMALGGIMPAQKLRRQTEVQPSG